MQASRPAGRRQELNRPAELRELRTFLVVARLGSFQAAAREVHLTQQAVSAHVQRLERDLGIALLRRTTRRVSLTPIGQEFAETSSRLLREIDDLWEKTRSRCSGETGTVRFGIGYSAGYDLAPELLEAVATLHPGISVDLRELITSELVLQLQIGEIEAGMALAPGSTEGLSGWPIATGTMSALLTRSHPFKKRRLVNAEDLSDLNLVLPQPQMTPGLYEANMAFVEEASIPLTTRSMTSHGIPRAVYEGKAFVLWPTVIPRRYVPNGLTTVAIKGPHPSVAMWMLFHPEAAGPPARRLIEVAAQLWPEEPTDAG
jgi:DNA-binding transcriptional LysR family regulator